MTAPLHAPAVTAPIAADEPTHSTWLPTKPWTRKVARGEALEVVVLKETVTERYEEWTWTRRTGVDRSHLMIRGGQWFVLAVAFDRDEPLKVPTWIDPNCGERPKGSLNWVTTQASIEADRLYDAIESARRMGV